jgi:hypothetical protein
MRWLYKQIFSCYLWASYHKGAMTASSRSDASLEEFLKESFQAILRIVAYNDSLICSKISNESCRFWYCLLIWTFNIGNESINARSI